MPSTSVHLPAPLLQRLDNLAAQRGVSRNRLITEACEDLVVRDLGEWPPELFDDSRLSAEEIAEMREGAGEMLDAILASRKSRRTSAL